MVSPATAISLPLCLDFASGILIASLNPVTGDRFRKYHRVGNMDLKKKLLREEDGQGLVEYTLLVLVVALLFWMGVRDTNIGTSLTEGWAKISDCVFSPFSCRP
jgi:Flp pilus assembly pilin Flp